MSFLEIVALLVGLPYAALIAALVYLTVRDLLDTRALARSKPPAPQASAGDAGENPAARTPWDDALTFVGWDRR